MEEIWHPLFQSLVVLPPYLPVPLPWKQARGLKKPLNAEKEEMPEKLDPEVKKEIAKITMTASLGVTVITAPFLKKNKTLKNIHTGAGVLLVGSALWHHFLYHSEKKAKKAIPAEPETKKA